MLGARDEVAEGIRLAQQLSVVVPPAAHLAAAPDVRDRIAEAAVEQRKPRDGEAGVDGDLVAAIPVQQAWRAAIPRRSLPADQRDRDLGAVASGGPFPVLLVIGGILSGAVRARQHRPPP